MPAQSTLDGDSGEVREKQHVYLCITCVPPPPSTGAAVVTDCILGLKSHLRNSRKNVADAREEEKEVASEANSFLTNEERTGFGRGRRR